MYIQIEKKKIDSKSRKVCITQFTQDQILYNF